MKSVSRQIALLVLGLAWLSPAYVAAQEQCEPWYSVPHYALDGNSTGKVRNRSYSLTATIEPTAAEMVVTNYTTHSAAIGFWGYYLAEPQPPVVTATDGDHDERVEVEWEIVDDRTGPPVTGDKVTLYRNGYVLTTLPITQREYQDFNVFPGEVYNYAVTTANEMGESHRDLDVGFLNPNGVVIGAVKTPNGNAVQDVKVVLTPNLGRSALFDGDAYVYFPELLSGLGADYTIEGWFRSRESQRQTLFAAVDSATVDHFALIELTAEGKLRWQHSGTAGEEGTSVISVEGYVEDGDWHHFAAVFDSVANQPSTMVLYVDGDVVASAQAGAAIGADEKVQIAMGKLGPKEHSRYLDGRLDDWRVWDVPRSRAEIRSDRDRTLAGDEEGLHAYWKFDEVRGEIVFDLTANDNDGRLCRVERSDFIAPVFVGALTDELGRYSIRGIYYASGTEFTVTPYKETPVGRSLRFDGVDDYVDFPHRRLDFTQGYTLEGWFKSPGGEGDMTLFTGVNAATGDPQVRVELLDDGRLKCAHMSNELASTVLFDHDYWHHFAVAYDADEEGVAFYIDGEAVGTAVNADPIAGMSAFALARQSPQTAGRFYAGLLDEIRVWDYGRTAEQIGGTMRQTLGGDETGVAAYWRLNEGDGDLVTDSSSGGRSGSIQGGVAWADDIPLSETFVHSFDAESRQVILNPSNTSVDRVDFTDISQIGVGGYVKYEATPCFIEGAEVLVNGESLTPPIYTDENGKFIAEFEPGATGQILTIRYRDHEFVPPLVELPRITVPRTGLYFNDREKREVSGKVAGGACEFPITPSQGQIEVTFAAIGGCAEFTAVPDEQTGMFTIRDVPPLIYQMTVDHPDPEIDAFFTGDTLSLENEDREVSFVYRSAPQVAITGFPENACGLRVMEMEQSYPLDIEVYEEYTAYLDVNGVQTAVVNSCPVNSGTLTILDAIGDRSPVEGTFENGGATYAIIAGYPNILDGGDHPYQKNIQVAVVDDLERTATAEEWTIVSGHRPRNTAFATTTPEIPVLILRDPPGDESYSFLSQGTTMEQSVSFGMNRGSGVEAYAAVHLGPDVEIEAGFFISKTTAIDVTLDFTSEFSMGISQSNASEQTWSFSTTESFETTGDGDVYVGGAMNIVYGVTDVLEIDAQTCEPYVWQDMVLVPDGFATTYIYSESQILDNVIPNLRAIGDDVSADRWESFVAMNQGLKDRATFSRNISFDAGAVFEYEETSEVTESQTYEFELEVEQAFAMDVGLTVDGMGATGGQRVSSQMTVGNSRTSSTTSSNTVGFVLADDDGGGTFTLNVKNDPVYGTPVFETVSGFSQCPWEENTVPLDGAQLGVSPALEIDVPPDEVAVFTLDIGNVSEADADREYQLRVINQSNPDGAVIAVNGVVLEEALSFFVPAGEQVQATMTVARGPEAYAYEDLQVQLVPPCEYESWLGGDDLQQADTVSVAVHYLEPCSECNVAVPENGWLVTAADQTSELMVTLDGY
ncbi:MAG: LamG domain-containing protein, partial [Gemmatimonadetes bacterium]|nr:LamG domain-containing protein [Gemmatimonadota bacterium]